MERLALGITRQLRSRGWDAELIFGKGPEEERLLNWAAAQGVPATANGAVLSVMEPARSWRSVPALARLIRSKRVRVVNFHYGGSHISIKDVLAARLAGARPVANLHLPVEWEHSGRRKRLLTRASSYLCSAVVVHSRAVEDVARSAGIPREKVHVVPPGIVPPRQVPKADARRNLGIPADAVVVGCMARMARHKGITDLILAFARSSAPNAMLVLAGDGPERPAIEQLADELAPGRVRFLGWLERVDDFYAALDVFALPSHLEGFGLVFVEAALHGVPGVGNRIGGVVDAVADGKSGILVPDGDVDALAAALDRLLASECERRALGDEAMRRANALFLEESMGRRQEAVLLGQRLSDG